MDGPASGQAQIERSLIFRVNTNLQFKSFVLWLYVCVCVAVMGLVQKKKALSICQESTTSLYGTMTKSSNVNLVGNEFTDQIF